ncbi:hypothetical protein A4X09_0g7253 [Tilletia walkeri]|uniref:Uncharacterized protein n=1 Tax=Tilletia walkeri TaxID=117179 RepID=A0A8X7N151_9BASI|nr:hypothetical protein A4X09_0g7253 [Tilletia walkeri]
MSSQLCGWKGDQATRAAAGTIEVFVTGAGGRFSADVVIHGHRLSGAAEEERVEILVMLMVSWNQDAARGSEPVFEHFRIDLVGGHRQRLKAMAVRANVRETVGVINHHHVQQSTESSTASFLLVHTDSTP